jgi:hypothetical protein
MPTGPKLASGLRALAEMVEGVELSKSAFADAEYAHRKMVEHLGPVWAVNLPADRLAKFIGKQSVSLNTFGAAGITAVNSKPIDLIEVVRQAFSVIERCRDVIDWRNKGGDISATTKELESLRLRCEKLQSEVAALSDHDPDGEGGGIASEMEQEKLRRLRSLSETSEVNLRIKTGSLVRAEDVEPLLTMVADRIRAAGDVIGQRYGGDAQRIVIGAVDEAERRLAELRRRLRAKDAIEPETSS